MLVGPQPFDRVVVEREGASHSVRRAVQRVRVPVVRRAGRVENDRAAQSSVMNLLKDQEQPVDVN